MTEERLLDSDEDIEEETPKPKRENSTIRQLREAQEAAAKERDEFRERAAKAEAAILSNSGLTEKQQAAFTAMGYTIDQVDQFRTEVLGIEEAPKEEASTEAAEEDTSEDITAEQAGFAPTITAGQPPGSKPLTSNEIVELMRTDPAKADRLLRSGKIVRQEFNPGGPRF